MRKLSEIANEKILLDTNILVNYSVEKYRINSGNILRTLLNNKNVMGISAITVLELLKEGCDPTDQRYYFKLVNYIPAISIDKDIIQNAYTIASEYRRILHKKNLPVADLIIAGTVAAHDNVLLLTTDKRDFCEPIWETAAHLGVPADQNGAIMGHLYLKKFNEDILLPDLKAKKQPKKA